MFRSNRERRNVRRSLEEPAPRRSAYPNPDIDSDSPFEKPKKRRWLKRLMIVFGLLVVVLAVIAALAYFLIQKTPLRGESAGRINILLMGVDDAAKLSDTLMIVSIDTKSSPQKAAMISIPRDLYVKIPDYGSNKINAAYSFGQNEDEAKGGVTLTKQVVEDTFDVPIHYYASLDFTGFRQIIDSIGGVDVDVKETIDDPYYPDAQFQGYEHFMIDAGRHHMDGATALKYARSRQTTTDFDRAARQQQIIVATKQKLLSANTLLNKTKTDDLQQIVNEHGVSDISTREALKLADMWRKIPEQNITRHVIDSSNFLTSSQRYGYALVPNAGANDFSEIVDFIKNIFSQTSNNLPEAQQ